MTTTNEIPADALYGESAERITRPNDGETIETRLGRIEAWMRNEIFARTACDEPDPDTGDDEGQWERLAKWHGTYISEGDLRRIVADACRLGLAVRPDDPRLHPLVVTDDTVRLLRLYTGMYWTHGPGKGRDDTSTAPNESLRFGLEMLFGDLNAAREVER